MASVVISGSGLFTPPETISNEELVEAFNQYVRRFNRDHAEAIASGEKEELKESTAEFIENASGIKSRYVMSKAGILDPEIMAPRIPERPDEEPSLQAEIAVKAARAALQQAKKQPEDVDALLIGCSNLQRQYPAVAAEVQALLGTKGYSLDMNMACSSATFGIQMARDAILNESASCVLIVNPELCSGHLNFRDRDSHFIFGDAATAVVVERADTCQVPEAFEILGTKLHTQFSSNIRNNFGFMNRTHPETIGTFDKLFVQRGRRVFKDIVPMVSNLIREHLESLHLQPEEIKCFWLHQANLSMNQLISKKLLKREASFEEAPVTLDEYANTSSAGSIIAFHKHRDHVQVGDMGVICSFGAGYSVGVVTMQKIQIPH